MVSVQVGDVAQVRDLAVDLGRYGHHLVAKPEVHRQPIGDPHVVLQETGEQPLPILADRIDLAGHREIDVRRPAGQEQLEVVEGDDAAGLAGGVLVELHVLRLSAELEQVAAARRDQRVAELPVVEPIVARQPEVAGHLRDQSLDRQVAEFLAGQPRHVGRDVDGPAVVGQRHRSIQAGAKLVEHALRKRVLPFAGHVGIPRGFFDDRDRRLVRRDARHVAAIVRHPPEEAVGGRHPVIDPQLIQVLVGGLGFGEQVFGAAVAERAAVGAREQDVEISRHRGMQRDRTAGDDAAPRIIVWNRRDAGDAETLDQAFIGAEKERPVALQRSAEHAAKLVAGESGFGSDAGSKKLRASSAELRWNSNSEP